MTLKGKKRRRAKHQNTLASISWMHLCLESKHTPHPFLFFAGKCKYSLLFLIVSIISEDIGLSMSSNQGAERSIIYQWETTKSFKTNNPLHSLSRHNNENGIFLTSHASHVGSATHFMNMSNRWHEIPQHPCFGIPYLLCYMKMMYRRCSWTSSNPKK